MNPETFPHRKDTAYGMSPDCRCGADDAGAVGIGATWGTDCPAALREALEAERARAPGPHIPPALLRRIEALGFVPGSGESVGWLVAELERLKADHTALLLGVGHPMWLPSVADAVDHPDQFNATPDEVLHRVRAVVAERDELAVTLANERAAWVDMREDVLRNEMAPGGTIEINDVLYKIDEYMPAARTEPAPVALAARSAGGGAS